jgi:DNA-binding transcriptional MerR regulator
VDAAENQPRLGEVLIAHGVLSEAQLADALVEQERTGDRLGKVLIDMGVPAHKIAMALADQVGGPVKTEYGVATGWSTPPNAQELRDIAPPQKSPEVEELEARLEERERQLEALRQELEALRGNDDEGPDRDDFLVVAVVDGRYVVHLGRGAAPAVGTPVQLPGMAGQVVVTRERPRRCLYTAPVSAAAARPAA